MCLIGTHRIGCPTFLGKQPRFEKLLLVLRLQVQFVLQFRLPTSVAGVPRTRVGGARSLACPVLVCVVPQVVQFVPDPGVSVRQTIVRVSVSLFLGSFRCLQSV